MLLVTEDDVNREDFMALKVIDVTPPSHRPIEMSSEAPFEE